MSQPVPCETLELDDLLQPTTDTANTVINNILNVIAFFISIRLSKLKIFLVTQYNNYTQDYKQIFKNNIKKGAFHPVY
ncbi:hypothetical protein GCM10011364_21310 [Mangrovimonas yunxiaonensis]|nr:hypothetical protein GCM10011364_21310 [Mangrovimonas yunxiaonensis]